MQIELLTYDVNSQQQSQTATPARTTASVQYRTTSDGFNIIANYQNDPKVKELTDFLAQVVKTKLDQFRLVGVEFKEEPVVLYRLRYQMISFNIIQSVYIQYVGPNSYRLIDSNYSQP
jgi:hypothetical protein